MHCFTRSRCNLSQHKESPRCSHKTTLVYLHHSSNGARWQRSKHDSLAASLHEIHVVVAVSLQSREHKAAKMRKQQRQRRLHVKRGVVCDQKAGVGREEHLGFVGEEAVAASGRKGFGVSCERRGRWRGRALTQ